MIKTFLTNFGYIIYEGNELLKAKSAAEKAGFEAVIYNSLDNTTMTYSPISGWRTSHG